jgi:hypothetical protein
VHSTSQRLQFAATQTPTWPCLLPPLAAAAALLLLLLLVALAVALSPATRADRPLM